MNFLVATLIVGFVIYVAALSLNPSAIQADPSSLSVSAHVTRLLTVLVVLLFLNSLVFRAISRIWPVRGNATFSSIFEFQCYMYAILLPGMALDLLLGFVAPEIRLAAGAVIGFTGAVFWNFPGIAGSQRSLNAPCVGWRIVLARSARFC